MGCSVLAYQFVAGFKDKLKSKLVGQVDLLRNFSAKLVFEEARLRETAAGGKSAGNPSKARHSKLPLFNQSATNERNKDHTPAAKTDQAYFSWGGAGNFQRDCPLKGRRLPAESHGGGRGKAKRGQSRDPKTVSMVRPDANPEQANPSMKRM